MRSIVTVTTPATVTNLTTVERVQRDLSIDGQAESITDGIAAVSAGINAYLERTLARETVSETFRLDEAPESLLLSRWPVVSISSVTEDDVTVDSDEYEVDPSSGLLFRLDASGYRSAWESTKSVVVAYVAGYLMPGESGRTLPRDIEQAAVEFMRTLWSSRRDPAIKGEEAPGVFKVEYWVGRIGNEPLPPEVMRYIAPYRRRP